MRFALVNGKRSLADGSGTVGICEICRNTAIQKCGSIMTWHWAHSSLADCDPWSEPMTEWHKSWQDIAASVNPESVEVRIERGVECHRADIRCRSGMIIEIQNSSISPEDIRIRESFYGKVMWIFDARDAYEQNRFCINKKNGRITFRWKHPRKSVIACQGRVLLDLGNDLFEITGCKQYDNGVFAGGGKLHARYQVESAVLSSV